MKRPIETLIETFDLGELPVFLRQASDEQLKEWEALLDEEYDRLRAVFDDPVLLDMDKLDAIEERHDAVIATLIDVRDEQERRAGIDNEDEEDD
jgi:hypothetical protein